MYQFPSRRCSSFMQRFTVQLFGRIRIYNWFSQTFDKILLFTETQSRKLVGSFRFKVVHTELASIGDKMMPIPHSFKMSMTVLIRLHTALSLAGSNDPKSSISFTALKRTAVTYIVWPYIRFNFQEQYRIIGYSINHIGY